MHQHDHARRMTHDLSADYRLPAVVQMESKPHILDAENRPLIYQLATHHRDRTFHIDTVSGTLQRFAHAVDIHIQRS